MGENFRFVSLSSVFVSKIKRAHFARFTREKEEEDKEKTKEQHETRISFTSVRIAQHATQQASHGRRRHRHALFRLLLLSLHLSSSFLFALRARDLRGKSFLRRRSSKSSSSSQNRIESAFAAARTRRRRSKQQQTSSFSTLFCHLGQRERRE
jgi:hypothetical protein